MKAVLKPYVSTYFVIYFLAFAINSSAVMLVCGLLLKSDDQFEYIYIGIFFCLFTALCWTFYHEFTFEAGALSGRYTYYGIPLKKAYQRNQVGCVKLISKQEPIMDGYPPFTLIIELNDGSYDIIRMGFYSRSQILEFFSKTDLKFEEHHTDARLV